MYQNLEDYRRSYLFPCQKEGQGESVKEDCSYVFLSYVPQENKDSMKKHGLRRACCVQGASGSVAGVCVKGEKKLR